jgi:hypothetical protein
MSQGKSAIIFVINVEIYAQYLGKLLYGRVPQYCETWSLERLFFWDRYGICRCYYGEFQCRALTIVRPRGKLTSEEKNG